VTWQPRKWWALRCVREVVERNTPHHKMMRRQRWFQQIIKNMIDRKTKKSKKEEGGN
jgi:hypothetical protein